MKRISILCAALLATAACAAEPVHQSGPFDVNATPGPFTTAAVDLSGPTFGPSSPAAICAVTIAWRMGAPAVVEIAYSTAWLTAAQGIPCDAQKAAALAAALNAFLNPPQR